MPFSPTQEQLAARDATIGLDAGEIVALNACAGSGKTTTTAFIAEAASSQRGWRALYICYNKDMADAARGRFPASVDCRTVHSLAHASVGHRYRRKLGNLRARDVMDLMSCTADDARAAISTVNQYLCSDAGSPEMSHVIAAVGDTDSTLLRLASKLWARMRDEADPMPMTHDGYLKLYVMSSPELRDIDLVLVDESQDLNPVILQLVLALVEKGARAVFVGDTHQSLYGFRLAIDAMQEVSKLATHNLTLSESWRFPQPIADMASKVLRRLKEVEFRLVGRGDGRPHKDSPEHCTLARTNALLIAAAQHALAAGHEIHFAATKASDGFDPFVPYRFQEILDIWTIFTGRGRPQTAYLSRFTNFGELERYAKGDDGETPDPELAPLVDFVVRHGGAVPELLRGLSAKSVPPHATPHHFSTAHRAKGREWNRVTLMDDFIPLDDPTALQKWKSEHSRREYIEAANLLYVAVTRGRCAFAAPASSAQFFQGFAPAAGIPSLPAQTPRPHNDRRPSLLRPGRLRWRS